MFSAFFFADYLRVFEWASTVDWRGLIAKEAW